MKIAGLIPSSLIDYPEKIAAVVFTKGCNFRCPYCHNPELVNTLDNVDFLEEKDFFGFLNKRFGLLDGVVVTGGEPTLYYKELPAFLRQIKEMGFLVKLDTNGSHPEVIRFLYSEHLVDFIAMDIKASPEGYLKTAGYPGSLEPIMESISLTAQGPILYEFRTTVVPGLTSNKEMEGLCRMIRGAQTYVIQNFRGTRTLSPTFSSCRSFSLQELKEFQDIAREYVKNVTLRP